MVIPSPQQNSANWVHYALYLKEEGNKDSCYYHNFFTFVPGIFEFDELKFQMFFCPKHHDEFGIGWRKWSLCKVPLAMAPHHVNNLEKEERKGVYIVTDKPQIILKWGPG